MQVFSNNRIVSHFPKAPPPSAHAKLRARGLRTIFFKSPDFLRRGKPEFPLRKRPPSPRRLPARQFPILRPKKRRRISGKSFPAGARKSECPAERKIRAARTERKL
ncbi:MAG: hypothetical protein BHW65_05695 [Verrucomicrobia bacterium CAG:312_58_20]|nr:MAG: hypothetical protein BHW65_05695 [Verrucomicrobia bacterium CAG:312_58_20]